MSKEDEYIERLYYLGGKKGGYKVGKGKGKWEVRRYDKGLSSLPYKESGDKYIDAGRARELLVEGAKRGDVHLALTGAFLYERLGKGDKPYIKQKLMEAAEKCAKENRLYDEDRNNIERFIKRHSKQGKLEQTIEATVAIVGILGGLFLLSPVLTGNAINSLNNTFSNVGGSIVLILGIIAGFLALRHN